MKRPVRLLIFLAAGIIIAIMSWHYVNRPVAKVESAEALRTSAEDLARDYTNDELKANKKYLDHAVEVTGTVSEVSKNQDGKTVVLLQSEDPMSGVQCTFRDNAAVMPGKQVTIKGFCTGYTFVVLLSACILIS